MAFGSEPIVLWLMISRITFYDNKRLCLNRVSYAKAKKSGASDYTLSANVGKYLGPKFKKTLKMKK